MWKLKFAIFFIIKFLFSIIFDTCGDHYDGHCKKKKKRCCSSARHIYGFRNDPKHYADRRARISTIHTAYADTLWTRRITAWLVKKEKNNTLDRKRSDSVKIYVYKYKKISTYVWSILLILRYLTGYTTNSTSTGSSSQDQWSLRIVQINYLKKIINVFLLIVN